MRGWIAMAGAALGGLTVAFGAFGAHALKDRLSAEQAVWFEKAVHWQGLHALALLAVALASARAPHRAWRVAGLAFVAGTVLFSGSLYAMALGAPRALGMVTPLGGTAFLVGWAAILVGARRAADAA
ncbi:MAG: DUF423 domain-containing protein [Planctomycetota bacterium]